MAADNAPPATPRGADPDELRWLVRKVLARWMVGPAVQLQGPLYSDRNSFLARHTKPVVASLILSDGAPRTDGFHAAHFDGLIADLAMSFGVAIRQENILASRSLVLETYEHRYWELEERVRKYEAAAERFRKRTRRRNREHHMQAIGRSAAALAAMYAVPRELPPEYYDPVPPE
jgi:hypothetical protein